MLSPYKNQQKYQGEAEYEMKGVNVKGVDSRGGAILFSCLFSIRTQIIQILRTNFRTFNRTWYVFYVLISEDIEWNQSAVRTYLVLPGCTY